MSVARSFIQLNLLDVWRREIEVWGSRLTPPSLDRLVCLMLHRLGWMGKRERLLFSEWIQPGSTVVDIGANQGLYALLFSKLVGAGGHVVAFEPEPDMFAALSHNCEVNSADNVQILNVALGSHAGKTKLSRSLVHGGDNRMAPGQNPLITRSIDVQVATLDEVIAGRPVDFIKMDVQGWEWECIRGMQNTLDQNRKLQLYFEFWPMGLRNAGCNPEELLTYLDGEGFRLFEHPDGKPRAVSKDLGANLSGQQFVNILAQR